VIAGNPETDTAGYRCITTTDSDTTADYTGSKAAVSFDRSMRIAAAAVAAFGSAVEEYIKPRWSPPPPPDPDARFRRREALRNDLGRGRMAQRQVARKKRRF
jgi:hypothetical protein